ncbi:hypothetical protein IQ259_17450 [Fortiea sp. LEGE XX443]|uniref:hypothetical protein n=1 Tax=Fortiea sp. LEGE XX443 TaxID=1828611 RepID=UPI00187FA4E6|nr:hypothetical protein [Fortiea sp. LEGE XX443]MBE9006803.1 hypothetical protein [Fortiea sp. LEGE XX443]
MRKLSVTALTFALVFFGIMILNHVPINLTVQKDKVLERLANMTFFESSSNNIVEEDGIQFKTVMSERILRIPPKEPEAKTQVQFGIQITNNTTNPRNFLLFAVLPEFFQANKQKVPQFGPVANSTSAPELSDFKLLMPGESVTFLVEGYFEWFKDGLQFAFMRKDATYWWYGNFESGTYSIKVIYENPYPAWDQASWGDGIISLMPKRKQPRNSYLPLKIIKIEDVWVGKILTPSIEFKLIQQKSEF